MRVHRYDLNDGKGTIFLEIQAQNEKRFSQLIDLNGLDIKDHTFEIVKHEFEDEQVYFVQKQTE